MTDAAPTPRSPVLAVFTSHWMAMTGLGLVLTATISWACLLPTTLRHGQDNPYVGVAMLAIGSAFGVGLVMTPFGLYLGRRRLRQRLATAITDKKMHWRRLVVFLVVVSLFNLLIASQMTLRALHTMESRQFCGSCHVMTPEKRAFELGPHAGILCVDCHVGDGAAGLIKSKLQGTHQLISVLTDTVKMPIAGAIEAGLMVPSAETCEQCHWREQPANARLRMIRKYAEDEKNTPETTLLTMNVGGTHMGGIHGAHNSPDVEIRFVATDARRQDIPLVEYRDKKTGVTRTFVKQGVDAKALASAPRITMQCFDCHNRPAHVFQMPDRAIDRALLLGRMSASLPFLKKTGVAILKTAYASSEAAADEIPKALASYYEKSHPDVAHARAAEISEAGAVLADIYSRNVFPELHVDWGTYPDNRGHQEFPGCFRCHEGKHATATGELVTNNCHRCHYPAAVGETNPEVLQLLGLDTLLNKIEKK
jgi:nitrate/TMAO reductase-like tetraheme cytochrome c subunit